MKVGLLAVLAVVAAAAVAVWACGPITVKPEHCSDGIDNDQNGKTDCADYDACKDDPFCKNVIADSGVDAGYWGPCGKCGNGCSKQLECLTSPNGTEGWSDINNPLPFCADAGEGSKKCQAFSTNLRLRVEVDTANWAGTSFIIRSMNIRFVSKKAVNGTPVDCSTVAAVATGGSADQIEASGKFNLLAWDTIPVNCAPGFICTQPFLPSQTGSDFLIWVELWAGPLDSAKYPTGNRLGKPGCFETGAAVEPITMADGYPGDGGPPGRVIKLLMPAPQ
jgi:hypothetical protein